MALTLALCTAQAAGCVTIPADAARSPFGIEYVVVALNMHDEHTADIYRSIGAHWVKFENCPWRFMEPKPPVNGVHQYDWQTMDNQVRWWQQRGFQIQIQVKVINDWAGQPPKGPLSFNKELIERYHWAISTPPKEEYWDAWRQFSKAFVERYDGDGVDDMPGLRYPILYYEVESEAQHMYWMGTIEEYGRALQIFFEAAKAACPEVKVMLSGIGLDRRAEDNPSDEVLGQRNRAWVDRTQDRLKEYVAGIQTFIEKTLAMGRYYDIVEFHALTDYTVIPGTAAYLRRKLREDGLEKEMWAGDVNSAPEVGSIAALMGPETVGGEKGRVNRILRTPADKDYAEVSRWYRRQQAILTTKKAVVSIDSHLSRMFFCCLEDWPGAPTPYHGLTDKDGTPRPVFRMLQFMTRNLDDFTREERLQSAPGVYAFHFTGPAMDTYALWYETDTVELDLPSDHEPRQTFSLAVKARRAQVITLDEAVANPETGGQSRTIKNGALPMELDRVPVFVRVSRKGE